MNKLAKCITYVTQDTKRCQISNLWNIAMVLSSILGVRTSLRIPIFKLLRISTLFPQYLSFARSIKQVKFGLTRKKEVVFKMNLAWPCMFCDSLGILPVWHSVVEQTSGVVDHHYTFHSYTFIDFFFLQNFFCSL